MTEEYYEQMGWEADEPYTEEELIELEEEYSRTIGYGGGE